MSNIIKTVKTSLSKKSVIEKAIIDMSLQDYELTTQTDTTYIFEDGKNYSNVLMIIVILLFFPIAIAYYLRAKNHKILLKIEETEDGTSVQSSTTTPKSVRVARLFLQSLDSLT